MENSKKSLSEQRTALKNRLEKLAWLSDSSIKLPGKLRIGLDSVIGLIPVIGDFSTALLSLYILLIGLRSRVPKLVIFRMSLYIIWDTTFGAIPVIGDLYDMIFKSNQRNVMLLNKYIENPEFIEKKTRIWVLLLLFVLLCSVLLSLWFTWHMMQWVVSFF